MPGRQPLTAAVLALVVCLAETSLVLTQGAAGPLGVADATASRLLVDAILHDAIRIARDGAVSTTSEIVTAVNKAYDKMPLAARGPATTAAFAWAKAFVNSPAFAAAYARQREGQKPAGAANTSSVDAELEKMMDAQRAAQAEARKMAERLPEKDRAALLAQLKAQEEQLANPETIKIWRAGLEAQRGANSESSDKAMVNWEARYPENYHVFVREHLERFLAVTENLDYSVATVVIKGPGGETIGFLSPGYTGMPWQRIHAILAGREAVDAGRAAAAAWLKELGGK